jgi:hypothetical protein
MSESHVQHSDPRLSGIASRVIANLIKRSPARFPGIVDFLSGNLAMLAYRHLFEDLAVAFPDLVPRTAEFYEGLLADGKTVGPAVQFVHEVGRKCDEIAVVLGGLGVLRKLLVIAARERPFVSLRALETVAKVAPGAAVVQEFEAEFETIVLLNDCRLGVLVSLYPRRIKLHIDDFLASRTSTGYDSALVGALRRIEPVEFVALVERPGLLSTATENLGQSKVNGHIATFLRILNERKGLSPSLQTSEWVEFVEGTLFPHLHQLNASYGGPYVQRVQGAKFPVSPSNENLEVTLTETPKLSSSSGSASDDEPVSGHRPARSTEVVHISRRSVTQVPGFDFVANPQSQRSLPLVNVSELPSLNAGGAVQERRARKRNSGSVTLADLPKCLRP